MIRTLFILGFLGGMIGLAFAEDGAERRSDNDVLQASFEEQFAELDANRDGKLDSRELSKLPGDDLAKLRNHGLNEKSGASIAEFSKVRMAVVAAEAEVEAAAKTADVGETDEPSAIRDEDGPESADAKTDSTRSDASPKAKSSDREVAKPVPTTGSAKETENGTPEDAPSSSTATAAGASRISRGNFKKTHFVPELPAEYAARDKNGDGQIGLYEWDRKKYAEFAKLDKNGDGFLTPTELLSKATLKNLYAGASNPPVAGGGKGSTERKTGEDGTEQEARNAFTGLDGDKNGMVDETEWGRSRRTRQMFESASVPVSLPINADAFLSLYRRAKEASGRDEPR